MQSTLNKSVSFQLMMREADDEVYVAEPETFTIQHASGYGQEKLVRLRETMGEPTLEHVLEAHEFRQLRQYLGWRMADLSDLWTRPLDQAEALGRFKVKLIRFEEQEFLLLVRNKATYEEPVEIMQNEREFFYQAIVSNIPGLIYRLQLHPGNRFVFPYLSEGCERLLEVTPQALKADPSIFIDKMLVDDKQSFMKALQASAENLTALNWEGRIWSTDFQDIKWISLRSSPRRLPDGVVQWDGIMNNITQSKKEKHQIEESHRLLAELSYEMEKIKEYERIKIAREIHDDLGGNLTAIKIGLSSVIRKLGGQDQGLIEKLLQLESIVDQTFEAVHRISSDLRPDVLDLGIVDALSWQAKQFERQIGIPCIFTTNHQQQRLSSEQEIALFRICQEALSNIAKHAQASEVSISLMFDPAEVTMRISDDGIGISPENLVKPNSFGLRGMAERISALKGSFEIGHGEHRGTVKVFRLPLWLGQES